MNKFILKYKTPSLIAFVLLSISSCLKDTGYENGTYGMAPVTGGEFVSVPLASSSPNALALESKSGNQTLSLFQVAYEYVDAAKEDIKVGFTKDDAAVTATDATLTLLPAAVLSFTGAPEVTIKAGARVSGNFTMNINTGTLDPLKTYGVAFTISSVSKSSVSIPKNLKTVVYKIALKNKYDGVYKVTGTMVDAANGGLTNWMPFWTANLETTGPNSVAVRDMTYTGGIYHPIMNGGAASYYGTFGMYVTFDGATNKAVDMVSPYEPGQIPGGATNSRTARLDPNFTSTFDPATRTIRIKYFMYQPTVIASGPRVVFDETWTYQKSR
jgi:hypothetical protein